MTSQVLALIAASLLLAESVPASAQSLAEVARQEAARRRSTTATGKVFTNTDLKPVPAPSQPAATPPADAGKTDAPKADTPKADATTPAAAKTADTAKTATPGADDKKDESYWRKRVAAARDNVARAQTCQDALQARIAALSTDFVNRDDPAQRNQIAIDRQKALAELDRVKKDITQGQAELVSIADEARRAGVPAGWVR